MTLRTRPGALATALAFLLAAACSRGSTATAPADAGSQPELMVFAAASMKEPLEALGRQFAARSPNVRVSFNFAGTQALRSQLERGAHADVFISADERHMKALVDQQLVEAPAVFTCNSLVLVVPADNPARISDLSELPRAPRVVLAAKEVPAGAYAEAVLDQARALYGDDFAERVRRQVVSRELNVRQVLARVVLGEADAGIVYASDASSAKDKVHALPLPPSIHVVARYPIAVVRGTSLPELAAAFVSLVRSEEGRRELDARGFGACPAEGATR